MLAIALLMVSFQVNAQMSYFNQDPCMQQLMQNGCTEVFDHVEITDPILDVLCPGMKVKLTVSRLVCNGVTVSAHIWSSGAWAPATSPCSPSVGGLGNPNWEILKAAMKKAVEDQSSAYIASLGLSNVLVSTGSVCKSEVTFEVGPFDRAIPVDGGSGINYVNDPGGKYTFTLPCKSDLCCFGHAQVVNGKVVGVVPAPNPSAPDCPDQLTQADVQTWFNQTFNVIPNPNTGQIFNVVIEPCQEECDLSRLVGRSGKSTGNIAAGQKIDYNIAIVSIKETSLIFKSDVMPANYQILDLNGRIIDNKSIQSNKIDIASLSKGIFFFKANYDNGLSSVVKFIKE